MRLITPEWRSNLASCKLRRGSVGRMACTLALTVLRMLMGDPFAESITSPVRANRGVSCMRGVSIGIAPVTTDGVESPAPPGVAAVVRPRVARPQPIGVAAAAAALRLEVRDAAGPSVSRGTFGRAMLRGGCMIDEGGGISSAAAFLRFAACWIACSTSPPHSSKNSRIVMLRTASGSLRSS
eukprot:scaffold305850_cov36-Tisochrysis_lutea.AAC.1